MAGGLRPHWNQERRDIFMKPTLHLHTELWIESARDARRRRVITHRRICLILLPVAALACVWAVRLILSGRFAL